MSDISLETVTGKLNRVGYDAFMKALRQAKGAGNRNVELAHWMLHFVQNERSDISLTLEHFKIDRSKVLGDITKIVEGFRKNETEMPDISPQITDVLDRGWHYATLFFGETQIRSGHLLASAYKSRELRRAFQQLSKLFADIDIDQLMAESSRIWSNSDEDNLRPMDGSGLAAPSATGGDGDAQRGTTALDRFSVDLTANAATGEMDPIVGRDEEIRQIIDVLMRRRQNNPILTGEAGVGKTAVVEGFAQRLAAGDVPPQLQGVRLCALDIGLMQAGASMKGEFEQRLRSVIDEVQASPTKIILFIDEAHTLIGAGGASGTGDAANLLKPALARGTLRTIAATTFAEYRLHIEKDPALTRRFQPVEIEEPSIEKCCYMLRGILAPMEKHHQVRISDEAIVAAVTLSSRYIPARQLPDKAVSLLDTACARVAISQSTTPAAIADTKVKIEACEKELDSQEREIEIGIVDQKRIDELKVEIIEANEQLAELEKKFTSEKALVDEILELRAEMAKARDGQSDIAVEEGNDEAATNADEEASVESSSEPFGSLDDANNDNAEEGDAPAPEVDAAEVDTDELQTTLTSRVEDLEAIDPEARMIYAHVDSQSVASIVSDWTGIPVGKMVKDEVENILKLAETLNERVLGQSHGLEMIAKRIETNRAKLDNPNKPIGVFMLCGPSGVGKTETALALAEALYGGEQNIITINMSEFQEAHTVSLLKGAPPGYVGYGEGGRLTEAVRRKPYSVVLLDEVEKAHSDVHELFFQVFDKGLMEDGNGRAIDFKNTLIILTSNVGTEVIMKMAEDGKVRPDPKTLNDAMKPSLTQVFPPALLGRIVTIPYFPLSGNMLGGIVKLQLNRITKRIKENHDAVFEYSDAVVEHIVSKCNDPDSGGRMIDNIITNTLLPELSRHFLNRSLEKDEIESAKVDMKDGVFVYEIE